MKAKSSFVLFLLRLVIGWHFLYEGLIKLFSPEWSSASYLENSYGFLSSFFNSLAGSELSLQIIDFMNIWGLILIGLGLMLGILTRISTISGMILLTMYYLAYPPFGESLLNATDGHYWIINRNLVEIFALLIIFFMPAREFSIVSIIKSKNADLVAEDENEVPIEEPSSKRRELIKGLVSLPLVGGVVFAAASKAAGAALDGSTGATISLANYNLNDLEGTMQTGRIGDLEFSRLIFGCNLISGYAHSRDLHYVGSLFRHYNTERKIYETYQISEQAGINTTNMVLGSYKFFNKYAKATGSRLKTIAQVHVEPENEDQLIQFKQAKDFGATTMYVQGGCADQLVKSERVDLILKAVEYTRSQGMLAGIGAHSIQVVLECEKAGIKPDYYFKTVHHDNYWSAHPREFRREFDIDQVRNLDHNMSHDNIFDIFPEQTVDVFEKINVPLFGFKVLAGGAITPEDGFRYAFESGSDFICVGMFDFQIVENVNLVNKILAGEINRKRPWLA